jgi:hypothetical protein
LSHDPVLQLQLQYPLFKLVIAYISGVLAGVSLIFEPISRQSEIALYTLNKSTEVLYNMAKRRKWLVKVPFGEGWLMAVSLAVICYSYV